MDKAKHEMLFRLQHQLLWGSLSIYGLKAAKGVFKVGYSLLFYAPSWFQEALTLTPTLLLFACHFKFKVPGEILIFVTVAAFLQQFSSQSGSNARALGAS